MSPSLIKYDCAFCGSSEFEEISSEGMHGFPTKVSICIQCGLVQLNPRWSEATYKDFYENDFDQYYRESTSGEHKIKTILLRMKLHGFYANNPQNILDIGAGRGDVLLYLKNHVYAESSYFAIEPSKECALSLQENGIKLISRSVESDLGKDYEEFFDFIILRHVLEHTFDPKVVLERISKMLKKNGVLYVAVPNAMKPTYPIRNNHFRNVHLYYFNKFILSNLLRDTGLKIQMIAEGDSFLPSELFCFSAKSMQDECDVKDVISAQKQKQKYIRRLKIEKYFIFGIIMRLYSKYNKFVSRIRKFWYEIRFPEIFNR